MGIPRLEIGERTTNTASLTWSDEKSEAVSGRRSGERAEREHQALCLEGESGETDARIRVVPETVGDRTRQTPNRPVPVQEQNLMVKMLQKGLG